MTSEERLLNLIRKKNQDTAQASRENKKDNEPAKKDQGAGKPKQEFSFDILKISNRIFLVLSVLILAYILMTYARGSDKGKIALDEPEKMIKEEKGAEKTAPVETFLEENKPFSFYQQKIERRDIFHSPWDKPQEAADAPPAAVNAELPKQLKLIGVVLDDDPKAIIEDAQTRETVFLSIGESISGAVIEEIKEGKVILRLNEEKVELIQ